MDLVVWAKIEEYKEKKAQKEALEAEMKELNNEIVEAMNNAGINKTETPNGTTARVDIKITLKYDEPKTIKWLKENGYEKYITEKIDTAALNKIVKESKSLNESLQPSQSIVYALTVK